MGNLASKKKGQNESLAAGWPGVLPPGGGLPSIVQIPSIADVLEFHPPGPHSPAYACSSVKGKRASMEDEHIAVRPLLCNIQEPANLFGVFDGHGGKAVAAFLRDNMPSAVAWSVQTAVTNRTCMEQALKDAFIQVDAAFLRSKDGGSEMGSCAVVVLMKGRTVLRCSRLTARVCCMLEIRCRVDKNGLALLCPPFQLPVVLRQHRGLTSDSHQRRSVTCLLFHSVTSICEHSHYSDLILFQPRHDA